MLHGELGTEKIIAWRSVERCGEKKNLNTSNFTVQASNFNVWTWIFNFSCIAFHCLGRWIKKFEKIMCYAVINATRTLITTVQTLICTVFVHRLLPIMRILFLNLLKILFHELGIIPFSHFSVLTLSFKKKTYIYTVWGT